MRSPLQYEQTKEKFERFRERFAQTIIICREIVQHYLSGGSSG
jgi:hypothetical protein